NKVRLQQHNTWRGRPYPYRPARSEVRLRAAYFEFADDDDARQCLEDHLRHYEQVVKDIHGQIDELREQSSDFHKQRLARYPEADHAKITRFKIFAYEGILKQAEAEISWAQDGLAMLESVEASSSS